MRRAIRAIGVIAVASGLLAVPAPAPSAAYSVNFGCVNGDRDMGATAYYGRRGRKLWYVSRIAYKYVNSGGGKANSRFRLYNGRGALAWPWATPDDRKNKAYKKSVKREIRRGRFARIWQRTWFDTFGKDPTCSRSAYF